MFIKLFFYINPYYILLLYCFTILYGCVIFFLVQCFKYNITETENEWKKQQYGANSTNNGESADLGQIRYVLQIGKAGTDPKQLNS